jgi:hypothetical protein
MFSSNAFFETSANQIPFYGNNSIENLTFPSANSNGFSFGNSQNNVNTNINENQSFPSANSNGFSFGNSQNNPNSFSVFSVAKSNNNTNQDPLLNQNQNAGFSGFRFDFVMPDINNNIITIPPEPLVNEDPNLRYYREACASGEIEEASSLFATFVKIISDSKNYDLYKKEFKDNFNYELAFHKACLNGNLQLAKLLLKKNPNINITKYEKSEESNFYLVCRKGNVEMAEWLLEINKSNINDDELNMCIYEAHTRKDIIMISFLMLNID